MTVRFYMDVHVPLAITTELRLRGVNVLTAQEDGAAREKDPQLLNRASGLGRVLVTQDADLLREAAPPAAAINFICGNRLRPPT